MADLTAQGSQIAASEKLPSDMQEKAVLTTEIERGGDDAVAQASTSAPTPVVTSTTVEPPPAHGKRTRDDAGDDNISSSEGYDIAQTNSPSVEQPARKARVTSTPDGPQQVSTSTDAGAASASAESKSAAPFVPTWGSALLSGAFGSGLAGTVATSSGGDASGATAPAPAFGAKPSGGFGASGGFGTAAGGFGSSTGSGGGFGFGGAASFTGGSALAAFTSANKPKISFAAFSSSSSATSSPGPAADAEGEAGVASSPGDGSPAAPAAGSGASGNGDASWGGAGKPQTTAKRRREVEGGAAGAPSEGGDASEAAGEGEDGDDGEAPPYDAERSDGTGSPLIELPPESTINGEEEDATVLQFRAKLFVLEKAGAQGGSRWRECGIGPLRLNARRDVHAAATGRQQPAAAGGAANGAGPSARLIMRQEHHPGGHGTRLLLNAALYRGMPCGRHPVDEKAVTLTALTAEAPRALAPVAGSSDSLSPEDASSSAGAGGSAQPHVFMLRLPKPDNAAALVAALDKYKALCTAPAPAAAPVAGEGISVPASTEPATVVATSSSSAPASAKIASNEDAAAPAPSSAQAGAGND